MIYNLFTLKVFKKHTLRINDEKDTTDLLDKVWEVYNVYSSLELSSITHIEGSPWYQVTSSHRLFCMENEIAIPNSLIKKYYLEKIST